MAKSKKYDSDKMKYPLLRLLKKLRPYERELLIKELDEPAIDKLSEGVYNLLYNKNLDIKKSTRRKLREEFRNNPDVRYVCNPEKPWKKRKKKFVQLGSGKFLRYHSVPKSNYEYYRYITPCLSFGSDY